MGEKIFQNFIKVEEKHLGLRGWPAPLEAIARKGSILLRDIFIWHTHERRIALHAREQLGSGVFAFACENFLAVKFLHLLLRINCQNWNLNGKDTAPVQLRFDFDLSSH